MSNKTQKTKSQSRGKDRRKKDIKSHDDMKRLADAAERIADSMEKLTETKR